MFKTIVIPFLLMSFTASAASKPVCKISASDFSGLNNVLIQQVWDALEKNGYVVTKKIIDRDVRYDLRINWNSYYHNPLMKYAESTATLTTPEGRPYSASARDGGGILSDSSPYPGPAIVSSVKRLPKCKKIAVSNEDETEEEAQ